MEGTSDHPVVISPEGKRLYSKRGRPPKALKLPPPIPLGEAEAEKDKSAVSALRAGFRKWAADAWPTLQKEILDLLRHGTKDDAVRAQVALKLLDKIAPDQRDDGKAGGDRPVNIQINNLSRGQPPKRGKVITVTPE